MSLHIVPSLWVCWFYLFSAAAKGNLGSQVGATHISGFASQLGKAEIRAHESFIL